MPDRATIQSVTQLGVETTSGTGVTAGKKPTAFQLSLDAAGEFSRFGPMGTILDTVVVPRQEWSTFALSGYPDYNGIVYPLSGVIGAAVITTPGGGTNSRLWTFTLASDGIQTPKTYTIQNGDANNAEEATYGLFTGLTLGFSRAADPSMSGAGICQRLDYGASLDGSPTELANVPILAGQVDFYADDASGSLGGTKLTRDMSCEFSISDRWQPIWPLNSALSSFAAHTLGRPNIGLRFSLGNDATGRAYVDLFRAGTTKFIRIEATGANIEGSIPYRLRIDMAVKINAVPSRGDINGLNVLNWAGTIVHDSTWGKGLVITAQNALTAL